METTVIIEHSSPADANGRGQSFCQENENRCNSKTTIAKQLNNTMLQQYHRGNSVTHSSNMTTRNRKTRTAGNRMSSQANLEYY